MFFADESTGTGSSEFEEALTEAKEEPSGEDEEESSEETTEEGEEKSSFEEAFANALSDAKTKVDNANKEAKEAERLWWKTPRLFIEKKKKQKEELLEKKL